MRYRRLGRSELEVSVISLGTASLGRRGMEEARAIVNAALDEGITLIDTAAAYSNSEQTLGDALAGRRHEAIILTKYAHPSAGRPDTAPASRASVLKSLENSLRTLRTDYIDIFAMHFPDPSTPMDETLQTADELVRAGKVRYLGCSNFAAWQIVEAAWIARTCRISEFICSEDRYSLLSVKPEYDIIPVCLDYGLGELAFSALHYGLLTGRFKRGQWVPPETRLASASRASPLGDELFDKVEALEEFAGQIGVSLLQLAVGGLAAQPGVASVIVGSSNPTQLRASSSASNWVPSATELLALNQLRANWSSHNVSH